METRIRIDRVVILRGNAPEPDRLQQQRGDALSPHFVHDLGAIAFDRPHYRPQAARGAPQSA